MKILIEENNLPELKVGDVKEVMGEDEKFYSFEGSDISLCVVPKEHASVLIKSWEALKYLGEGKEVQEWHDQKFIWEDVEHDDLVGTKFHYRLKPEPQKPKYEPFTMEDWEVFTKMPVRKKSEQYFWFITEFDNERITDSASYTYTYTYTLEALEFIDGRPFGKEVK